MIELIELALLPFFIVINGFFSGAELAIITANRGKLTELSAQGSRSAATVLRLKDHPDRFLPTIQIGITLVGTLTSAIGGMRLVGWLEGHLTPLIGERADQPVALIVVVGAISFLSLVVGELAPKNLALRVPERFALIAARPLDVLEEAALPVVRVLDWATALVLAPFGGRARGGTKVSREELRNVLFEGYRQGTYSQIERTLLQRVIELMNATVADAALPRTEVVTAPPTATLGQLQGGAARAPGGFVVLYEPAGDHVHGVLGWREVYAGPSERPAREAALKTLFVPESAPLPQAIDQMQSAGAEVAIVVNEYGEFEGLLGLSTLFQRQVLTFALPPEAHPGIQPIERGWRIKGTVPLAVLRERFALPLEDSLFYATLGGFVLEAFGRLPHVGESFELFGYRFSVEKMERTRVDEVAVERL